MDEYINASQSFLKRVWAGIKRHKIKSIAGVIILVIFAGAALKGVPQTEQAQAVLKQVSIIEASALTSDGGTVPVVGTLEANEQLDLRPQIAGQVDQVHVSLNQEVTVGQVLVELKHADLDASVAQASASLQSAIASLDKMRNGARAEDVVIAQQNVEAAKQQLEDMKNGGRPEEVAQAQNAVNSAELAVDDAYTNHRQTVDQNQTSFNGVLENSVQAIQGAQFAADQILEQDLRTVFDANNDYKLFAIITDTILENQANNKRREVENQLDKWRDDFASLQPQDKQSVLNALERARAELNEFVDFLDITGDALDEAHPSLDYDAAAISSAVSTVNLSRSTIKGQLDAMIAQKQAIQSQEIANAKALELAQTQIDNAETALANAKEQLEIVKKGATPEQIAIQQTAVSQAEQRLLIAQNGARPEDIRLQQASVAQARASLALAVANRDKAIVRAPISGKITYLPVEISDIVSSSTIVVSLANESGLEVTTYVTEDERAFIAIGNTVTINEEIEGVVSEIAPALDPVNKKIEVTVAVVTEETNLTLGETVRLEIQKIAPEQSSLKVPLSTVKLLPDSAIVYLVNTEGVIDAFEVEIGDITANKIEILTPFPENAKVVEDARGLKEGEEVVIK
jgi:multidrug efflux pump subunit AcrA (membrane-fusion protein)